MNKKVIVIGFVIGLLTTFIGVTIYTLYIHIKFDLSFQDITSKIVSINTIGKRAGIGVLLNLPVFYYFLHQKKEDYSKGVLIAIVLVTLIFIINKL